jgi:hypothetical protein
MPWTRFRTRSAGRRRRPHRSIGRDVATGCLLTEKRPFSYKIWYTKKVYNIAAGRRSLLKHEVFL